MDYRVKMVLTAIGIPGIIFCLGYLADGIVPATIFGVALGIPATIGALGGLYSSRQAMRERTSKQLFGHERLQILEKRWRLEDLMSTREDPDGRFKKSIKECDAQLADIDRAVVALYEDEFAAVHQQNEIVERVKKITEQSKNDLRSPAHRLERVR